MGLARAVVWILSHDDDRNLIKWSHCEDESWTVRWRTRDQVFGWGRKGGKEGRRVGWRGIYVDRDRDTGKGRGERGSVRKNAEKTFSMGG
jgi:hypothetical protein